MNKEFITIKVVDDYGGKSVGSVVVPAPRRGDEFETKEEYDKALEEWEAEVVKIMDSLENKNLQ